MNAWHLAAIGFLLCLVPCVVVTMKGEPMKRLIGMAMANTVSMLVLIALAGAFDRDFFFDLVLSQALLSIGSTLVYVRFMERWL